VPVVADVPLVVLLALSPMEPACALSFVAVALMPTVLDGVIKPLAFTVVNAPAAPLIGEFVIAVPDIVPPANAGVEMTGLLSVGLVPNTSAPLPVSSEITPASCAEVVAANCASVPVVAAMDVMQKNPVPGFHRNALFAPPQLGMENAVGLAVDPVTLAMTVFAATGANPLAVTFAHAGGVLAPVETIACPAVEPEGFSS
jgi:hypothetical protein